MMSHSGWSVKVLDSLQKYVVQSDCSNRVFRRMCIKPDVIYQLYQVVRILCLFRSLERT